MNKPKDLARFTMKPSRFILFLRTFAPYQLWRFALVNLRMIVMIWKSHG
jgi:hypothetical protein